jgi:hypothetical protein
MRTVVPALVVLTGCYGAPPQGFAGLDGLQGLTDPVVAQGLVLGIETPDHPAVDKALERAGIDPGVAVTMFLANASSLGDLDSLPLEGARVVVQTPEDAVDAPDLGDGLYLLEPRDSELRYRDGELWTLWAAVGRSTDSAIDVALPGAAPVDVPSEHALGTPLDLDFTGMGYDHALVAVYDLDGNEVWTNEPRSIEDIYELTASTGDAGIVRVPADAFDREGVLAVGVAGLYDAQPEHVYQLNTALSSATAGKMRVHAVTVR